MQDLDLWSDSNNAVESWDSLTPETGKYTDINGHPIVLVVGDWYDGLDKNVPSFIRSLYKRVSWVIVNYSNPFQFFCRYRYLHQLLVSMAMNTKVRNEEVGVVLKRFGDEQSTLLDKFERLSFEVRLNQAILGRSLSEPGEVSGSRFQVPMIGQAPEPEVKQGRRNGKMGFQRILKKLFRPILGRKVTKHKDSAPKMEAPDPRDLKSWKAFSRSLRI